MLRMLGARYEQDPARRRRARLRYRIGLAGQDGCAVRCGCLVVCHKIGRMLRIWVRDKAKQWGPWRDKAKQWGRDKAKQWGRDKAKQWGRDKAKH